MPCAIHNSQRASISWSAAPGHPHAAHGNSRAAEDKGWLRAYLGMMLEPDLRFHQAFEHPQGIDAAHAAFAELRTFVLSL